MRNHLTLSHQIFSHPPERTLSRRSSHMRLKVQRFDPGTQLKDHRICLFIGRRGTGKSKLLEDIMYRMSNRLDFGLAMTPTEETAAMYVSLNRRTLPPPVPVRFLWLKVRTSPAPFRFRKHMPDSWVYDGFNVSRLEQMMAMQRAAVARNKLRSLFLLTDDCGFDRTSFKNKTVRDLFMNGRHTRICYMTCMQYCMDITPDLRSQIDYVRMLGALNP